MSTPHGVVRHHNPAKVLIEIEKYLKKVKYKVEKYGQRN